jgi:asparagine synthase (glutamine-hydrolysing)
MCGIAGMVVGVGEKVHLEELQEMSLKIAHRGPDGRGEWVSESGSCGLVHRRLAIVELGEGGAQPMIIKEGRYGIVFNGEIYNAEELREELKKEGETFNSLSDTEVLIKWVIMKGKDGLTRLRGMYSFGLWDEVRGEFMMARDAFGIKPLYYFIQDKSLLFSSEMRGVEWAVKGKKMNKEGLLGLYQSGSVAEPMTLLQGVYQLKAGEVGVFKNGDLKIESYIDLGYRTNNQLDWEASKISVRQLLKDSVRAHLISDVPVGLLLSGGIDSNVILTLMKELNIKHIHTFTIGFDGGGEHELARQSAKHFGTIHHELILDEKIAAQKFQEYVEAVDQPSIDGFNLFVVCELVKKNGVKVVLSGLGGDECFAGYKSFWMLPYLILAHQLYDKMGFVGQWLKNWLSRSGSYGLQRISYFLASSGCLVDAYECLRGIFHEGDLRRLVKEAKREIIKEDNAAGLSEKISLLELKRYMRNQLLKDADVMSMRHGIELRVPFVDISFFQGLSNIPAKHRLKNGKLLLKEAMPELPEWIIKQKKKGFLFPYERWMRSGTWSDELMRCRTELSEIVGRKEVSWYQSWIYFLVQQWKARHSIE